MIDILLLSTALAVIALLYYQSLRNSLNWQATITPLASIIGSGFLISGPLLAHIAGLWAPVAMLGITLIAFAIGEVIRFNIKHAEPILKDNTALKVVSILERLSEIALGLAYIVSVAFYVRLLASFVLRFGDYQDAVIENIMTTTVLFFIATVGWLRGLGGLEKMEEAAVTVKLAIIMALIVGLIGYDVSWFSWGNGMPKLNSDIPMEQKIRLLAGLLLIVQGFETSRYLGKTYDQATRIQSMKYAQYLASIIYLLFVITGLPLLLEFHGGSDETAIIAMAGKIAMILPFMIVVAAAMSQFSAAIADTIGAGGLLSEISFGHLSPKQGYVCLVIAAIILIWLANVFEIITLASRFFALYYALQCLVALVVCISLKTSANATMHFFKLCAFTIMTVIMVLVVVFATPVG